MFNIYMEKAPVEILVLLWVKFLLQICKITYSTCKFADMELGILDIYNLDIVINSS